MDMRQRKSGGMIGEQGGGEMAREEGRRHAQMRNLNVSKEYGPSLFSNDTCFEGGIMRNALKTDC